MRYILVITHPQTTTRETRIFRTQKEMEICRELRERGGFHTRLRIVPAPHAE
jgi:hypothetical protein